MLLYFRVFNGLLQPFMGVTLHCTGITYFTGYSLYLAFQAGTTRLAGTTDKDSKVCTCCLHLSDIVSTCIELIVHCHYYYYVIMLLAL